MGLRCLLGHDYGETRTEREREERGDERVVTETEVEECSRCGKTRVVSENTEVTSLEHGARGGVERPAESGDETAVHTDRLVDSTGDPDESVGAGTGTDGSVEPADAHPPDDVEVVIDEAEPETQQRDDADHRSTDQAVGRESTDTRETPEQSPEEIAGLDESPDLGGPTLGDTSESERARRRDDAEIIGDDGGDGDTSTRDLGEWPESDATHPAAATDDTDAGTVDSGEVATTDDAVTVDSDTTDDAATAARDTTNVSAAADEDAEIVGTDEDAEIVGTDEDAEIVGTDEDAEIIGTNEDAEIVGTDEDLEAAGSDEDTGIVDENEDTGIVDENEDSEAVGTGEDAEIIDADELDDVGSARESGRMDTPAETDFDGEDDAEIIDADAATVEADADAVTGGADAEESSAVGKSVGTAERPETDTDEPSRVDASGASGASVDASSETSASSAAEHTDSDTESTVTEPGADSEQVTSADSETAADDQPVVDDAEIVEGPGGEDAEIVDDTAVEESPAAREARSDIVDEVEPGGEVSPGPESEDAEIVDGDTLSRGSGANTTAGDETAASADSEWPTHDIEDRGYDAEVETDDGSEDDVTVDGSLRPEIDVERLGDDTEFVESTDPDPTVRDTNGSNDERRDPTERGIDASIGDVSSEVADSVGTGGVDSGPSTPGPGVDLSTDHDDVNREYFCPSCGHAEPVGDSSLREGDNCPECMRDYIDERIVE